jgi:hypothetical protein
MIAENGPGRQGPSPGFGDETDGYPRYMRTLSKVSILGVAGYGGYRLWNARNRLWSGGTDRGANDRRISRRSGLTAAESAVGSDDPLAQATAILADSDDRSQLPRDAPGIEHRRSEDTVER